MPAYHSDAAFAASPLVGRDDELDLLRLVVRRGQALVQVEGEEGVGKSRLVRELAASAGRDFPAVLVGYCQQLREPFILGAVLEALRHARDRLAECRELNPVTAALRAAVPELADVLPTPAVGVGDPLFDRHLLFRAVREVLGAVGPTLLVIEDLQWADDGTLQLLRFLMADPPPRLAVVVTYRREEVAAGMPLGAAFRTGAGVASEIIRLRPLNPEQVRVLAAAILRSDTVTAEFGARLHEHTAGLPFVIEEVLRALRGEAGQAIADGVSARMLADRGEVPVLLRESVAERLAALTPDARALVRAAAVFTSPGDAEVLGEVADLKGARLRAAAEDALASSILQETPDGTWAFRHSLARQAVYSTISALERKDLHTRAARVLSGVLPPPLVQLAEHSRLSNQRADWLRYGEAAADQALTLLNATTATPMLRRLLAEPSLTAADVDRLSVKLGEASLLGLDVPSSAAALKRLVVDPRLSTTARGEVRTQLGVLLTRQAATLAEGRAQMELAVDELRDRPEAAAKVMSVLGQPFTGDTPLTQTSTWLRRADAAIARCPEGEGRFALAANVLGALAAVGDPSMDERLDAIPTVAHTIAEQRQVARAHCNLGDSLTIIGRFAQAGEHLRFGTRAAEESGALYVLSTARSTAIRLDWFTGAWDGLAERARSLLVEYRDLLTVAAELNLVLGLLALARGAWGEAAAHLESSGARTPRDAITPLALGGSAGLIRLALHHDDTVLAVLEADTGMTLLRHKGAWAWAGELAPAAVDAYLAAGRVKQAEEVVRAVEHGIRGVIAPLASAVLHLCRGAIADHTGRSGAQHHAEAARAFESLPAPYFAAIARERAEACRVAEGGARAIEVYRRGAERYEAVGATHDSARCRRLLRDLGASIPSRQGRRGYGNSLSPREREVARLLAAGHTNNEIAATLFLSHRTVEQHASRVLRKLNVPSRRHIRDVDLL